MTTGPRYRDIFGVLTRLNDALPPHVMQHLQATGVFSSLPPPPAGAPLTAAAAVPAPTNTGVLEQRISVGGKPGLRGEATYRIDPATGYFSYDFDAIWANLFGREIAVPGFVVERSASYIDAKYFDGRLWVERFYAEGPEGPRAEGPGA